VYNAISELFHVVGFSRPFHENSV